jgi:hypothetical protein
MKLKHGIKKDSLRAVFSILFGNSLKSAENDNQTGGFCIFFVFGAECGIS